MTYQVIVNEIAYKCIILDETPEAMARHYLFGKETEQRRRVVLVLQNDPKLLTHRGIGVRCAYGTAGDLALTILMSDVINEIKDIKQRTKESL